MPYLVVENFNGGLDTRRHILVSKPGTLAQILDAHITRGGEVEKRKAFVVSRVQEVDKQKAYGRIQMKSALNFTGLNIYSYWSPGVSGDPLMEGDEIIGVKYDLAGGFAQCAYSYIDYPGSTIGGRSPLVNPSNELFEFAQPRKTVDLFNYDQSAVTAADLVPNGDKFFRKTKFVFCENNGSYWMCRTAETDFFLGTATLTFAKQYDVPPIWPGAVEVNSNVVYDGQKGLASFDGEMTPSDILRSKHVTTGWVVPDDKMKMGYSSPSTVADTLPAEIYKKDMRVPYKVIPETFTGSGAALDFNWLNIPSMDDVGYNGISFFSDPSSAVFLREKDGLTYFESSIQCSVATVGDDPMDMERCITARKVLRNFFERQKVPKAGGIQPAQPETHDLLQAFAYSTSFISYKNPFNVNMAPEEAPPQANIDDPIYNQEFNHISVPPFSYSPSAYWPVAGSIFRVSPQISFFYYPGQIDGQDTEIDGCTVNAIITIKKIKIRSRIDPFPVRNCILEPDVDSEGNEIGWVHHSTKLIQFKLPDTSSTPRHLTVNIGKQMTLPVEDGYVYTVSDFRVTQVLRDSDGGAEVTLPEGTFGLENVGDRMYTFTSELGLTRTGPSWHNMYIVRLKHPKGANLTGIRSSTVFGGRVFVIGEFDDGSVLPFYGPSATSDDAEYDAIPAFTEGVSGLSDDLGAILERLRAEGVLSDVKNSGVGIYEVRTQPGVGYDVTKSTTGSASVEFTEISVQQPQVDEVASKGGFIINRGRSGSAAVRSGRMTFEIWPGDASVGRITGIYVGTSTADAVNIINAPQNGFGSLDFYSGREGWNQGPLTAYTFARYINNNTETSGYYAAYSIDNNRGTDSGYFDIYAPEEDGEEANGRIVWIEFDKPIAQFTPTHYGNYANWGSKQSSPFNPNRTIVTFGGQGGSFSGGTLIGVTSVMVDGEQIMAGNIVRYQGSVSKTAAEIAKAINESSYLYDATSRAGEVIISGKPGTGDTANGKRVEVFWTGDIEIGTITHMNGGKSAFLGKPQVLKLELINKGQKGDKFTFNLEPRSGVGDPVTIGAGRVAGLQANSCITFKSKVYVTSGSTIYFSGLNDATKWGTFDLGSGFIDMSNSLGERDEVVGAGLYQERLAVFTKRNVQIWIIDVDSANNEQSTTLMNTGCVASETITQMSAMDVLYLSESGVRSLRAREGTDSAFSMDIGSPIDTLVRSLMYQLGQTQTSRSCSVVDPKEGRFMMSLGSSIFVLSYYPGSNIAAWSRYQAPGVIEKMLSRSDGLIFMTCFDEEGVRRVYCYGGRTGQEYEDPDYVQDGETWNPVPDTGAHSAIVELPYLDAQKPATYKSVKAIDAVSTGGWEISLGMDHTSPNARDVVARTSGPTYALGQIPAVGIGTHIGVKMVSNLPGPATISNFIVHYDDMNSKHDAG